MTATLIVVAIITNCSSSACYKQEHPLHIIRGLSPAYCEALGKGLTEISPTSKYKCVIHP